jgi:hypothetical protein
MSGGAQACLSHEINQSAPRRAGAGKKFRCQSATTVLQKQPNALLKFAPVPAHMTSD